jgi:hypothetical protein
MKIIASVLSTSFSLFFPLPPPSSPFSHPLVCEWYQNDERVFFTVSSLIRTLHSWFSIELLSQLFFLLEKRDETSEEQRIVKITVDGRYG